MRLAYDHPIARSAALGALALVGTVTASCDKPCDCPAATPAAAIQGASTSPGAAGAATATAGVQAPTPAACEALFARVASDRSFEGIQGTIETGADETRTLSPQGGSKITLGPDGTMKLVDPAGRRVSLRRDGTVDDANYDVLLVAADGSRKVYWAAQRTVVAYDEYTKKLATGATGGGADGDGATPARDDAVPAGDGAKNDGKEEGKVTLCHVPPGNPANQHTITVGASAVDAHLRHGDYRGPCTGAGATSKGGSSDKGKSKGKGKGKDK